MTQAAVIQIKGRPWKDIEESIAALSLRDPSLATSADILTYLITVELPFELKSLIADYGAICAPVSYEQNEILQLRAYCLYATGRSRDALYCIKSLRYGVWDNATRDSAFWLTKMAVDAYYSGRYDDACAAIRCGNTFEDGSLNPTINSALLLLLEGDFGGAVALTNRMPRKEQVDLSWKLLIRGSAFAGLQMYDQAVHALDECIVDCQRSDIMAQAIAMRFSAEERRTITADKHQSESNKRNDSDGKHWIYDLHKKTAAAHGPVDISHLLRIPQTFECTITPFFSEPIQPTQRPTSMTSSDVVSVACFPFGNCIVS
jgi:hypothetical protein